MQFQQTIETLDVKDETIFYEKFKNTMSYLWAYSIFIHLLWFIIFLIDKRIYDDFAKASNIDMNKLTQNTGLILYIISAIPAWIGIVFNYSSYNKLYGVHCLNKIVYRGRIHEKSHKDYLINGERKPVLVLDFGTKEVIVPWEIFAHFRKNDVIALHFLEGREKVYRYEKIT